MKKVMSMRGKTIDIATMAARNSHKVALGNANMNARGDKVNQRGDVVATREMTMTEYNAANPRAVRQVGLSHIGREVLTPAEAAALLRKTDAKPPASQAPQTTHHKRKISDSEMD